ncbi:MAG: acyltransferase family protein [Melioribacteraceae bacterium]|nr:acyltransferase family protein [Melioribacteraceae bacterium]MCF8353185.1 acyltransferase family protein [Melioribacteraceae bacterium]MCF8395151.1 acyltransferase family protein [Melioribacteraceae bacterium]MCF8418018.1 acyltransferase family protein [Melioribacteraceae bacterium]
MEQTIRRHDIDWLRVLAFYLLIFFHVGMVFVPWEFHIKNSETVSWIENLMLWSNQWRLPLLFLISGIVLFYSMGKRSGKAFFAERSQRLAIPLVFGMLVVIPPQIYFERLFNGAHYANYWEFWETVFNFVAYPRGSLSWHHLWYVLYILIYSIVAFPIFKYLRGDKSLKFKNRISNVLKKYPSAIYLICVPLYFFYIYLADIFPTTNDFIRDWYKHSIYFTLFLAGFLISSVDGFWDAIVQKRKNSLIMGLGSGIVLMVFIWGETFEILYQKYFWFVYIYGVFKWMAIAVWLLAILGYGKVLLNKPSKALSYANESVYPLYILHQTVELIFAYYIVQLDWGVLPKFALLVFITFGVSLVLYELIIKRYNITRLFFGMKMKQKQLLISTNKFRNADDILLTNQVNIEN